MDRTISLDVKVTTYDPSPDAGTRIEFEVNRALRLMFGADRVYVELTVPPRAIPVYSYGSAGPVDEIPDTRAWDRP